MTPVARVLIAAAVLCFIIWGATLSVGLQPLIASDGYQIIYGEGEDFFSDAVAYRKARGDGFILLNLPHARSAYRWWTVDFGSQMITRSGPPRALGGRRYMVKGDLAGTKIDDQTQFRSWYWHFTPAGAAFAGNGFSCSMTRIHKGPSIR